MGLFIIAGLLIVFGILFWALNERYLEDWMQAATLICSIVSCVMLFILLLVMGVNRAESNIIDMKEDYDMCVLALEGCETINE